MIPALKRGLEILKQVAASERPLGYNEIVERTHIPPSSVTRLLKSLEEGRYLVRDAAGKYRAGNELRFSGGMAPTFARLLAQSKPVLASLSQRTRNTALLLYWNGQELQSLDKVVDPASIVMQEVGSISRDLSNAPWGWVFHAALDAAGRREADACMTDHARFRRRLKARLAWYEKHGFAYDDAEHFPHVRRLAAPVLEHGRVVGAVALGGNPLTIPDKAVLTCGAAVKAAARELSLAAPTAAGEPRGSVSGVRRGGSPAATTMRHPDRVKGVSIW
ncbi:MAG: hypothetical protein A3K19_18270 [Lentisphaerae bacterium RIFOXYB12_FULL_65_16]|nr:MAG: hypothetical protein A3K18_05300 [Lentisphaerae bacterium RIFOXYA12_64_32]OGV93756.1 MAG: hypothetical protein A3K19_18270 [Lentisphaerae bacterium RIFOXYB12_FULL_65_16]